MRELLSAHPQIKAVPIGSHKATRGVRVVGQGRVLSARDSRLGNCEQHDTALYIETGRVVES